MEYPKMLYLDNDTYIIVEDKENEESARKAGYKGFLELGEEEPPVKRGRPPKAAE